jgi:glycosyltransferase involved in cell wall biosynthesis
LSADRVPQEQLASFDITIYNFGNHFPFHREIFFLSQRWPGVCILHDFVMHHFFAEYYFEWAKDPAGYGRAMRRLYGTAGEQAARSRAIGTKGVWETDRVAAFPMFEDLLANARGVLVHSEFLRDKVGAVFAGPLRKVPLAYQVEMGGSSNKQALGLPPDVPLILSVGHVNPNRCIPLVLQALGRLRRDGLRFSYAVVGQCEPSLLASLKALAENSGLADTVHWAGTVSFERLRDYLASADLCINLRFPNIEGASGSIIEQMKCGKAVIVNNSGFFAELPDDSVVKVPPSHHEALGNEIERLLREDDARREMGRRARIYAEQEFSASNYASRLSDFLKEVRTAAPLLNLSDRVGSILAQMTVPPGSDLVGKTARELADLFGGTVRSAKRSTS